MAKGFEGTRRSVVRGALAVCAVAVLGCDASPPPPGGRDAPVARVAEGIINGTPLLPGEHPYAAFLNTTLINGATVACSGTLVSPDTVLTAAHCVVCSVSSQIRFVGQPGQVYSSTGTVHHPAAYPNPVPCTLPFDEYRQFLNDETVWGHDVAIVRLAATVPIEPLPPLLTPPFGYSPIASNYGKTVTIVGRGLPDVTVMERADITLHGFSPDPTLSHLSASLDRFSLVSGVAGGSPSIASGDSGGPMIAKVGGTDRVIGVATSEWEFFLTTFAHAPTFTATNARFLLPLVSLMSEAYAALVTVDSDGDDVPDKVDNCPFDANTDQLDFDKDGVGDICDNCAQANLFYQVLPISIEQAVGLENPNQANCNLDAEHEGLLSARPDLVLGGTARRVDMNEYSEIFALFGDNSAFQARRTWRRGDACDPIHCARADVRLEPLPAGNFVPLQCGVFATDCVVSGPTEIAFTPIRSGAPESGRIGVRQCACDLPHATEAERRTNCGSLALPAPCRVDAGLYFDDSHWAKLTLASQPPTVDVLTTGTFAPEAPTAFKPTVAWDFIADIERLTGVPTPPQPWTVIADGTLDGGGRLDGILWSEVVETAGVSTFTQTVLPHGVPVAALAANYGLNDPRLRVTSNPLPFPVPSCFPSCEPWHIFPYDFCPPCGFGLFPPWLELVSLAGSLHVVARNTERSQLMDDIVAPSARPLLDLALTRVPAAEPEYRLRQAGNSTRVVALDATGTEVVGQVGISSTGQLTRTGRLIDALATTASAATASPASACPGGAGAQRKLTYSGYRRELFSVVREPDEPHARLCVWEGDAWREEGLTGTRIAEPLAVTFHLDSSAVYVLDRVGAAQPPRLLRIDLPTGRVTVALQRAAPGGPSRVSLTVTHDGELLLAHSRQTPGLLRVERLGVGEAGVSVLGALQRPGERLAGDVRGTAWGIHYLDHRAQTLEIRALPWSTFSSKPGKGP